MWRVFRIVSLASLVLFDLLINSNDVKDFSFYDCSFFLIYSDSLRRRKAGCQAGSFGFVLGA